MACRWIPTPESNLLWGGPLYRWPITVEQIAEHQQKEEVSSFWLVSDEQKIGFIELFRLSEGEFRLCRVLINEEAGRGKGYGKQLVQMAIDYATENLSAHSLSLAVFEKNTPAIRCYESLGFRVTGRETSVRSFNNEDWPLLRMSLSSG
ncbi:GNAT family N-acetyltransferase [Veronia nyctiphanis]|uniref:GNAT family N-acetyltransferase n=1 Tax=Veronia nyctiphanis TaxID=1278244 RepID=A0A4Q0YX99_9GAMM|nr:GNAT family N-acetyltransferase [Veronia nyctiphanis]